MNRIFRGSLTGLCLMVIALFSAFKQPEQPQVLELESVFYPDLQVFFQYNADTREVHFSGAGEETSRFDIRLLDLEARELWSSSVEYGYAYAFPISLTAYQEEVFIIEINTGNRKVETMILSPSK